MFVRRRFACSRFQKLRFLGFGCPGLYGWTVQILIDSSVRCIPPVVVGRASLLSVAARFLRILQPRANLMQESPGA